MALAFILLTVFIDMLGLGLLLPVIPFVVRQFTTSAFAVGALSMSFAVFQFFAAPVMGRLSDRYGRRPLLLISLLGSAAGYLVFGLARSLPWLFAARIVDGVSGGNMSIAQAYIADVTDPAHRSRNFGLFGAAIGLGFILGPAIGGATAHVWGLAAPAYLAAGLALANAAFGAVVLPETRIASEERPTPLDWQTLNPITGILRGLTHRDLGLLFIVIFAYNVAYSGWQSNFALYTLVRFHWSAQDNALLFSAIGLTSAITQALIVRRLAQRTDDLTIAIAGLAIQAAAYILTALAPTTAWLYGASVVAALGLGITIPTLQGALSAAVSAQEQGVVLGAAQSIASLTRIIGPLWAGLTFDWLGPRTPYWSGALLFALGCAFTVHARRQRGRQVMAGS